MLDEFLPIYDNKAKYERLIAASPSDCFQALRQIDLGESFLIQLLFRLRGLKPKQLNELINNFILLSEDPPNEIILGLIGQPWTIRGGIIPLKSEEFVSFDISGYAKIVWNFQFKPDGDQTLAITETRIWCTDVQSRKKFQRYWWIVGPFSGLIRKEMLRLLEKKVLR